MDWIKDERHFNKWYIRSVSTSQKFMVEGIVFSPHRNRGSVRGKIKLHTPVGEVLITDDELIATRPSTRNLTTKEMQHKIEKKVNELINELHTL